MESTSSAAGPATGVNSLVAGDPRLRGEDVGREGIVLAALRQVQSPAARASKKRKNRKKREEAPGSSSAAAWPATDRHSWGSIAIVNPRLQDVLRVPGTSAPERIYGRRLTRTDRELYHSRLLMSCKSWRRRGETFPLERVLTDAEKAEGVEVQTYDRRGRLYDLVCKKLESNNAYRLVEGWGTFLRANGLVVEKKDGAEVLQPVIRFDLWTFRSPALRVGVTGQRGGPLGLLIMHYPQGDAPATQADAAIAQILAAAGNAVAMPMPLPGGAAAVPVLEDAVDAAHAEGAADAPEEENAVEADDGGRLAGREAAPARGCRC